MQEAGSDGSPELIGKYYVGQVPVRLKIRYPADIESQEFIAGIQV